MPDPRRGTYFAFQGLFMAVLLLLFLQHSRGAGGWTARTALLLLALGASMALIRAAPDALFANGWFQTGLFLADAGLASLALRWTRSHSELYPIYVLVVLGAALTRGLGQSLLVAGAASALYLATGWRPGRGLPGEAGFWLRVHLLWITSALLTLLSGDARRLQRDRERRYQERLVQIGRLAALGRVAGEVAHGIKAPLTTILVNAEVLSRRLGRSKDALRDLDEIRGEVGRCKDILKNLLDLGRIEEMALGPLDLRVPLRSALGAIAPQLRRRRVRLELAGLDAPLRVHADPSLLHEALVAVLRNAVEAAGAGGTIRVRTELRAAAPWWRPGRGRPAVLLSVEDDGDGIAPEDLERVFEPFFTTKGGEGTGLGLSAALRILHKHGGTISASSEGRGRGARFVLELPRLDVISRRSGTAGRSA